MREHDDIKAIIDIVVNEYQPDKIVLFGSRARGDNSDDSDIDILVISDKEKHLPRYKRGLGVRIKLSSIKTPFDILFYTQEELDRFKNIRQSFCAAVQREGIVLYD